jgi:hypothetical protein
MIHHPHHRRRPRRALAAAAGLVLTLGVVTGCGDDDDDDSPAIDSPGTTMPFVEDNGETLDSMGGPNGSVLNNQPTSPEVNNAPPGDDGTG